MSSITAADLASLDRINFRSTMTIQLPRGGPTLRRVSNRSFMRCKHGVLGEAKLIWMCNETGATTRHCDGACGEDKTP